MYMIASDFLSKYQVFRKTVDQNCAKLNLINSKFEFQKKESACTVGISSFLKELKKEHGRDSITL